MNHKSIVSMFLVLFFVVLGVSGMAACGYFLDTGNHNNIAATLGWTAAVMLVGALASFISLMRSLWE